MPRNMKAEGSPAAGSESPVSFFKFVSQRLKRHPPASSHAAADELRRTIQLAQQAYEADQTEQAERLIEAAYALYDKYMAVTARFGSQENHASGYTP